LTNKNFYLKRSRIEVCTACIDKAKELEIMLENSKNEENSWQKQHTSKCNESYDVQCYRPKAQVGYLNTMCPQ